MAAGAASTLACASLAVSFPLANTGNEGLEEAIGALEGVKAQCGPLTYADLYQLAGVSGCCYDLA